MLHHKQQHPGQLPNGQEVVVKRRSLHSNQGKEEFDNETVLAAKLHHRKLVKLIGFSEEGDEKLLIYEFMPNASLDRFIYDPDKHGVLDWETRLKIIKGIAEGLLHLHESSRDSAIHRDLKPSNILLDENLNPKIADFGLAKLLDGDQNHGNTRRPSGTM
ncbi:hypothetical protein Sjap_025322 [Stephania japonica]|uniref:non-specific serine/threonine protein kinase n=1 Tax=Stephania japonica TaxID=461633 RepID=A0AAP0E1L6_9MAGN